MAMGSMPLFQALKQKMNWHQTRQGVLAENVANAETPGYRARDLKVFDFKEHLNSVSTAQVTTAATQPGHFAVQINTTNGFDAQRAGDFEVTPEGNGVSLEDEMMKIASNQMDYQAATTLYSRSMRLVRTALGR